MGIFGDIGKWLDGAVNTIGDGAKAVGDAIASPFTRDFAAAYPEGDPEFKKHFPDWFKDHPSYSDRSVAVWDDGTKQVKFSDASGNRWSVKREPDGDVEWQVYDRGDREWRDPEEGEEVMRSISQAQEKPPDDLSDQEVSDVLGGPPKTYNPPDLSDEKVSDVLGGPSKTYNPGPPRPETGETLDPIPSSGPSPFGQPDPNNPTTPPPNYGPPIPPDKPIGDVLGGPPKTFNPSEPAPPSGTAGGSEAEEIQARQRAEELARYEQAQNPDLVAQQRAEELARYEQALGSQNPPAPDPRLEANITDPNESTLDPNLTDSNAPGPTLSPDLVDQIAQNPDLVNIINSMNRNPSYTDLFRDNPELLDYIIDSMNRDPNYTLDLEFVEPDDPRLGTHPRYVVPDQVLPDPNEPEGQVDPDDLVPYRDYISFYPMVLDPATGEWRNAQPGKIPGLAEGGWAE